MRIKLLVLMSLLGFVRCGENSMSINVKNAINVASDKFISFEADITDLLKLFRESKNLRNLSLLSPAYLKLKGCSTFFEGIEKVNETEVSALLQAMNAYQIIPVIVIDYNVSVFEPLTLLRQLKVARDLKIDKCIWQLGDSQVDFDTSTLRKYADDLRTLKILCESVKKEHFLDWNVAAVGVALKVDQKIPFDVSGYDLKRLSTGDVLSKTIPLASQSTAPLWITVEGSRDDNSAEISMAKPHSKHNETCDHECLINGLLHAQVLGEAARKGLDVLFFDEVLEKSLLSNLHLNPFQQAATILHKKLIGEKVFNVKVTKSSADGKLSKLYSYCSKKTSGAITLMGINFSNMRSKFNIKIASPIDTNAIIVQYLLSASDGHVLLNNERFNAEATPAYKFKKLSKFTISLVLPPFSMAFWTIKNAKVNECMNNLDVTVEKAPQMSSTDQLLKKLVANEFEGKTSNALEKEKFSRNKRQMGSAQYLPKFELELPFRFPSLMTSASNHKPIREVLFNKNTDVFKVAPVETNPLQSRENPSLPTGDVYLLVNDGKGFVEAENVDYIVDEKVESKKSKSSRKKSSGNRIKMTTEEPEYFIPYDYVDASQKTTKKSSKKSSKSEKPKEIGELFEAERSSISSSRIDQSRSPSTNIELTSVVKELEPTYRQSKTALMAAKRKWDRSQIMELLKDAQLEEVDKAAIQDADDFELIDLTQNADNPNYEEYDEEEDDDFFTDDKLHHVRTKRHVDYSKNEIPKHGAHMIEDDDDSIETLMDDVHVYLNRNTQETKDAHEEDNVAVKPLETPLTIKAVDFFTKSLNDVFSVAHKTFVGWWYVFNPSTRS